MDGDVFVAPSDELGEDGCRAELVVEEAEHPAKNTDRTTTSVNPELERRIRKITSRFLFRNNDSAAASKLSDRRSCIVQRFLQSIQPLAT